VEAEEGVRAGWVVGKTVTLLQQVADPRRLVCLVTMTVFTVIHDLAIMDTFLMVDLPEDDTTALRGPQTIAPGSMLHLLLRENPASYQCVTESRVGRERPFPHGSTYHQAVFEQFDLQAETFSNRAE
jgi:hypothetical protein